MKRYNFKVRYTDRSWLEEAGYGRVAHLPYILDSRPGYHRNGSQYLIDRGLGIWVGGQVKNKFHIPTSKSIRSYAAWLCNFLEWAESRNIELETADYHDHIYGRYQRELLLGIWGKFGHSLSETTVNLYVDTAVDFLMWMAAKDKRSPFEIPTVTRTITKTSAVSAVSHRSKTIEVRLGKVRQPPKSLRMPSSEDLDIWLKSVYERQGQTFGLMCDTVIQTAVRREEVCCWRVDTLPEDQSLWVIANPTAELCDQLVMINIRMGAKGPEFGFDHGDKIGPRRNIKIPLRLAIRLHHYRQKIRPKLLAMWVAKVRGAEAQRIRRDESVQLFLSPEGKPETSARFYNAWKAGEVPFKEWSPHLGRHWWACSTLMQEIQETSAFQDGINARAGSFIAAVLTDVIQMKITPQLGHVSSSTSSIYLQWVVDQMGVALPERYQAEMLDEDAIEN